MGLEDDRLQPAWIGEIESNLTIVARQRDQVKRRHDDLRRPFFLPFFLNEHNESRALPPGADHLDRKAWRGTLAGEDGRDHAGLEINGRHRRILARVGGVDRGQRLAITNQKAAGLDEPAVFTASQGLDACHQRMPRLVRRTTITVILAPDVFT